MANAEVIILSGPEEVGQRVCSYLEQASEMTISDKGKFVIGVSGGSVATLLNEHLPEIQTDWSKWFIFLCDERVVPHDDQDCTYSLYKSGLMNQVPIPEENFFKIEDPDAPLEDIVQSYSDALLGVLDGAGLDAVVLGLGPDGHTASLFPGHDSLSSSDVIVGETDSPKDPPVRISMTLKTLNSTSSAIFIACGQAKAEMLSQILNEEPDLSLPAAQINPQNGPLSWYLDVAAAKKLTPPVISDHQKRMVEAAFAFEEML